jgi:hypothetical protein
LLGSSTVAALVAILKVLRLRWQVFGDQCKILKSWKLFILVTSRGRVELWAWWGSRKFPFLSRARTKITNELGLWIFFDTVEKCAESNNSTYTMVKKRNRDPEVLPEAPPAHGEADDSGSDDVGSSTMRTWRRKLIKFRIWMWSMSNLNGSTSSQTSIFMD